MTAPVSPEAGPQPLGPEARALVLATLRQRVEAEQKMATALFSTALSAGVTLRLRSPLGDKLGSVLRTDPEVRWDVTDPDALDAHLRSFPGVVETTVGIDQADMPEALAVIAEHAPHLLTETTYVPRSAVQAALAQSKATGEPAAPGISKVRPGGVIQVRPDKGAAEAVARMVRAGLVDWASVLALDPPAVEEAAS